MLTCACIAFASHSSAVHTYHTFTCVCNRICISQLSSTHKPHLHLCLCNQVVDRWGSGHSTRLDAVLEMVSRWEHPFGLPSGCTTTAVAVAVLIFFRAPWQGFDVRMSWHVDAYVHTPYVHTHLTYTHLCMSLHALTHAHTHAHTHTHTFTHTPTRMQGCSRLLTQSLLIISC